MNGQHASGANYRLWQSWDTFRRLVCMRDMRSLPSQALQRQVEEQRASEDCRVQKMALENAALRRELAVYRSILGGTLGPSAS